jgi:hypothetical protein
MYCPTPSHAKTKTVARSQYGQILSSLANSNFQGGQNLLPCLLILRVNRNPERKSEDRSKRKKEEKKKEEKGKENWEGRKSGALARNFGAMQC